MRTQAAGIESLARRAMLVCFFLVESAAAYNGALFLDGGTLNGQAIDPADLTETEMAGALTLGIDLLTAYYRMETLEHFASIMFKAIQLGNVNEISSDKVKKLKDLN